MYNIIANDGERGRVELRYPESSRVIVLKSMRHLFISIMEPFFANISAAMVLSSLSAWIGS